MKKAPISAILETELDCLYYIHVFTVEIRNKTAIIELTEFDSPHWSG